MINDSDFYFSSWGTLYKNSLISKEAPKAINRKDEIWDNLKMITANLIGSTGNWSEIIIYDTLKDSVYLHSQNRHAGDLRYISKDYAITTKGLYDLKSDSLVNENSKLFQYNDIVVELKKFNDLYFFCDLKGNRLDKIPSQKNDHINDLKFTNNGNYMLNESYNEILIFDLSTNEKLEKKVSEKDKKTFDLK